MKSINFFLTIALIFGLSLAGNANAIPFPNPYPAVLGDDLDDSGIFVHNDTAFTVELFDLVEEITGIGLGSTFGFYFTNNPGTLFPIFDPFDSSPPLGTQWASIDFNAQMVWDGDDSSLQGTFTGSGNIGFFFNVPGQSVILYSEASLNPGGFDFAATYPVLGLPSELLIAFYLPVSDTLIPLAFEITSGISPVPEPATFLLFGCGLLGLARVRRKFKKA